VKITEPYTKVGNLVEPRVDLNDPASRRALIAAKARKEPKAQFSNLMHHLTPELMMECLMKIPKNSAPGPDGITVDQARKNLDWLLRPLMNQIHLKQYKAPPVRRVYIPKADGKQRPLGVPNVIDRAIQAGTAQVLNEIYEQDFLPCSFGFRPGLGCHHALATVSEHLRRWKLNYVLEVDIRDFFGSLSHEWLRKFLKHRISDQRVLKLIDSWLKAGVMEQGKWQAVEQGTPQGGSISPLLANIYLHYVLDLWFEKKINKQLHGKAKLVRYADDFMILFENQQDIETVKTLLKTRLEQFGLEMAEAKTHTTNMNPRQNGDKHERRHLSFLGFCIYRTKTRYQTGHKTVFQTDSKRYTRAKAAMKEQLWRMMHWDLKQQAERINAILRGHFNYYGLAGNTDRIQKFCYETIRYWRRCLSRRSQKGKFDWEAYNRILKEHPLIRPRIRISYSTLGSYVRL